MWIFMLFEKVGRKVEHWIGAPSEGATGFVERVESLRGIAALMVAICHSQLILVVDGHEDLWRLNISHVQGLQSFATKLLLMAFNGGAAVSLFFVISGLVLGLSLDRQKHGVLRGSASFILRRALRIYPALVLSLLLVQAWLPLIYPAPDYMGASLMFQPLYRVPQAADFFANLFFVSNQMNPVIWTLKIEMEVALLLPFFHMVNRKAAQSLNGIVLLLLMWLSATAQDTSTGKWVFAFYLGLMVPAWGPWLVSVITTAPFGLKFGLGMTLFMFGSVRHLLYGTDYATCTPFIEGLCAMTILALIVYCPELRWWKVLDWKGVRVMGRVSYSFYLFHFLICYLVGIALLQVVSRGALFSYPIVWHSLAGIASVALTIPLAMVSYRLVETVFIKAGKDLTRIMQPLSIDRYSGGLDGRGMSGQTESRAGTLSSL